MKSNTDPLSAYLRLCCSSYTQTVTGSRTLALDRICEDFPLPQEIFPSQGYSVSLFEGRVILYHPRGDGQLVSVLVGYAGSQVVPLGSVAPPTSHTQLQSPLSSATHTQIQALHGHQSTCTSPSTSLAHTLAQTTHIFSGQQRFLNTLK